MGDEEEVVATSQPETTTTATTTVKPTSETAEVTGEEVEPEPSSASTRTEDAVDGVTIISNTGTTNNGDNKSNSNMDASLVSNPNLSSSTKVNGNRGVCSAFYGFLFPRMAPIRGSTFLVLTLLSAIP